jgi:hypothetical protein
MTDTTTTTAASTEGTETVAQDAQDDPVADAAVDAKGDTEIEPQDAADDPDDGKSSKLRKRAQAAEQERDELADTLTRTRQAIVDRALGEAGLNKRLLTAAGYTLDSLVDDESGLISSDKLSAAVDEAVREFGVTPKSRRPAPNPLVGRGGGDKPEPDGLQTFREAFGAK